MMPSPPRGWMFFAIEKIQSGRVFRIKEKDGKNSSERICSPMMRRAASCSPSILTTPFRQHAARRNEALKMLRATPLTPPGFQTGREVARKYKAMAGTRTPRCQMPAIM